MGNYQIQCWGASGGESYGAGGKGAYTSGVLNVKNSLTLYVYVGNHPKRNEIIFNGYSHYNSGLADVYISPAGGATDIRLLGGDWKSLESRKARIMVAASGGGSATYNGISLIGGDAGGLKSYNTYYTYWMSPKLRASENPVTDQSGLLDKSKIKDTDINGFVVDGLGPYFGATDTNDDKMMPGIGNGYFTGIRYGYDSTVYSGMGGVCYVSGLIGCKAISSSFTDDNHKMSDSPDHYSGYVFTKGAIKSGKEEMPSPKGGKETGHTGNGYAIIQQK